MNLLHLKYFYEVARTGSFIESSRNLRVSQPAISKMVKQLEGDLGRQLLERSRKGVRMTDDGEVLFQSASLIFSEARNVREKLCSNDHVLRGEWGIGASDNIALHLIPKTLGQFKEKHPNLKITLFAGTSTQIKTELQYDRCRLGIFYTPISSSEPFEAKQIYEAEFWIVIAKKNKWLKTTKLCLDDIQRAKVPRIESRHSDYSAGFPAHFHSKKLGLTSQPWLEVNQHEIKKSLVLGGFGYALLTKHTVENEVSSGQLIRVTCPEKLRAPIFAVWRKGRDLDRVSQAFLEDWMRYSSRMHFLWKPSQDFIE